MVQPHILQLLTQYILPAKDMFVLGTVTQKQTQNMGVHCWVYTEEK